MIGKIKRNKWKIWRTYCLYEIRVVLGRDGGALPLMTLPYKLFVGGTVGSGEQWVSWVHVMDVVRAISFAIKNDHLSGPVNVTLLPL